MNVKRYFVLFLILAFGIQSLAAQYDEADEAVEAAEYAVEEAEQAEFAYSEEAADEAADAFRGHQFHHRLLRGI